jgi:hypothetical protein
MHPEMASDWRDRRIRELEAEVERLRAEVKGQKFATLGEWERLRAQVKLGEDIAHDLMLTQQEVERLRSALREHTPSNMWCSEHGHGFCSARQALEEK